jgi:hypothetical protein
MTCAEARPWLSLRQPLPLEAGAGLTAQLAEHVHSCPACSAFTSRAAAFDAAVGKSMRDVQVPCGLKSRMLIRIENARRAQSRQRLFRVAAPLAACLLVGVLYGHFQSQQRANTPVQLVEVQRWLETDLETSQRTRFDRWEAERQLPGEFRDRWNLSYYFHSYQAKYQGRWVTVLEYRRGASHALVVLLPPGQVEFQQVKHFQHPRYGNDPRVLGDTEKGEYLALVIIRSGQYDDFRKPAHLPSGA